MPAQSDSLRFGLKAFASDVDTICCFDMRNMEPQDFITYDNIIFESELKALPNYNSFDAPTYG